MNRSPNEAQLRAIEKTEGPVLILAGPGSGKTYTLVQRAMHLLRDKNVKPEQILIATFTDKAARELISRMTAELKQEGLPVDLGKMYIGTFHSIFFRLIQEHFPQEKYTLMDEFEQKYFILTHLKEFEDIPYEGVIYEPTFTAGRWKTEYDKPEIKAASAIADLVNRLHEDKITVEQLRDFPVSKKLLEVYESLLAKENKLDFSSLQTVFYDLMTDHPEILEEISNQIQYIMVDEFQDTNFIQSEILELFQTPNICVVGDDDQSIYRFRGASVKNILEFTYTHPDAEKIILNLNYRSNPEIIRFYESFMNLPNTKTASMNKITSFRWENDQGNFRYQKKLKSAKEESPHTSVLKISMPFEKREFMGNKAFCEKIATLVDELLDSGAVVDENQIVFLSSSLNYGLANDLKDYLPKREKRSYNIYSPRSDAFFSRKAIRGIFGLILLLYPNALDQFNNWLQEQNFKDLKDFVRESATAADTILEESGFSRRTMPGKFSGFKKNILENAHSFLDLFYGLLTLPYYETRLERDLTMDPLNQVSIRNLAELSKYIAAYDDLHQTARLTDDNIVEFFRNYVLSLQEEGLDEYEEASVLSPSGALSFMTIHQAKGLEFPVVIVLPDLNPRFDRDLLKEEEFRIEEALRPKESAEYEWKVWHDFFRLYYTAFSRAQDLLIIPHYSSKKLRKTFGGTTSRLFTLALEDIKEWEEKKYFRNNTVSETSGIHVKPSYAFTSHVGLYEQCPAYYKFYKELGFARSKNNHNTDVGSLVHVTIEKINKIVLEQGAENIEDGYFEPLIRSLVNEKKRDLELEDMEFHDEDIEKAVKHVSNYIRQQKKRWGMIQNAEIELIADCKTYFLKGTIDLIENEDGLLEIVDFKTGAKPDVRNLRDNRQLLHYRQQMEVYHYLLSRSPLVQQNGLRIKGASLYYTDDPEDPRLNILDENDIKRARKVDETMKFFDRIVQQIENRDFRHCSVRTSRCDHCDFLHHCHKPK